MISKCNTVPENRTYAFRNHLFVIKGMGNDTIIQKIALSLVNYERIIHGNTRKT